MAVLLIARDGLDVGVSDRSRWCGHCRRPSSQVEYKEGTPKPQSPMSCTIKIEEEKKRPTAVRRGSSDIWSFGARQRQNFTDVKPHSIRRHFNTYHQDEIHAAALTDLESGLSGLGPRHGCERLTLRSSRVGEALLARGGRSRAYPVVAL